MPGKRYEAKDKRVQKMSREGLVEENLRSGEHKRISKRTQDASLAKDGVEQSQPIRETASHRWRVVRNGSPVQWPKRM